MKPRLWLAVALLALGTACSTVPPAGSPATAIPASPCAAASRPSAAGSGGARPVVADHHARGGPAGLPGDHTDLAGAARGSAEPSQLLPRPDPPAVGAAGDRDEPGGASVDLVAFEREKIRFCTATASALAGGPSTSFRKSVRAA